MKLDKKLLRQEIKKKKTSLGEAEIASKTKATTEKLKEHVAWYSIKVLHTYETIRKLHEVDTKPIIEHVRFNHPNIKIFHPEEEPQDIDVVLVPLVAFDESCNRLGHGGGYYDRFLKKYPKAKKIGLAFEMQKLEKIPTEPHDIKLDAIITEKSVYT